jgi:hypothetical protein
VSHDIAKQTEVEDAYQTLREFERKQKMDFPLGDLKPMYFLFCADSCKYLHFEGEVKSRMVSFGRPWDMVRHQRIEDGRSYIELNLGLEHTWDMDPEQFYPPKVASTKKVYAWKGKGQYGHEYDFKIMFLSPGYLMVWVPWELLLINDRDGSLPPRPPGCPNGSGFAG